MSIEVRNVAKQFGGVAAVDDVSFTVEDGELLALLGPSGGGKTTVLRMIAGLEIPSDGEIVVDGRRMNDVPVQERNIGFVFQNYALFKTMSVRDNIAFGLSIRKWPRREIDARVEELLSLFGIAGLSRRFPHQLSGGQRQRVAIARALAPRPSVLLLDEPFGAVDAKVRQELRDWLVRLHRDLKVTTIFVTHDQEEAMEVSDRIVIFSKGRLEQIGTPREVYEEPANEFVARFIGVMNVAEVEVWNRVGRGDGLEFPLPDIADGAKVRVGFRPYSVEVSGDPADHDHRATVRRSYFLGVMMRVELELAGGFRIRARMSKEEHQRLGIFDGKAVSFRIKAHRVLSREPEFRSIAA